MFRLHRHLYLLLSVLTFLFVLSACSPLSDSQGGSSTTPTATPSGNQAVSATPTATPTGNQAGVNVTPTATVVPHSLDEQVSVGSWMITIEKYSSSGDSSYTPKAGNALLIFNIRQENQGSQSATASGAVDWSLQDDSGTPFPLITKSGYGTFPSGSVAAGDTATGTLVYEVPTSTQHCLLIFNPVTEKNQASWDVSL